MKIIKAVYHHFFIQKKKLNVK
uniref:Uncharacterized protein n=1 Tax=Arundo donax TaxID=35708 RepID=A0A0A8Y0D7_ARUDO